MKYGTLLADKIRKEEELKRKLESLPMSSIAPMKTSKRRLVLTNWQSPGDILMLTAAVRDLHLTYPGKFQTDVRTSSGQLWQNNPHITQFPEKWIDEEAALARDSGQLRERNDIAIIPMTYAITNRHHFVEDFQRYLGTVLGLEIPLHWFHGDIHLGNDEQAWISQIQEMGVNDPFWIINTGGKWDYTAKWCNWQTFQKVVNHYMGKITFVQVGDCGNWQPPLTNAINLVGSTDLRMLIRLIGHSTGVITPLNGIMHMAAAVPFKDGTCRPCVVLAGGREPPHWEMYPTHKYLTSLGTMPCCTPNCCNRARCTSVGDGDDKDKEGELCEWYGEYDPPNPAGCARQTSGRIIGLSLTQLRDFYIRSEPTRQKRFEELKSPSIDKVRIPRCLDMIQAGDIIKAVDSYYEGGLLK